MFSDDSIPTTAVSVANTERGHCSKTFAIFKLVLQRTRDLPNLRWLILADDDTLLRFVCLEHFKMTKDNVYVINTFGTVFTSEVLEGI